MLWLYPSSYSKRRSSKSNLFLKQSFIDSILDNQICDYQQLRCLFEQYDYVFKTNESSKDECHCLPSCMEMEVYTVHSTEKRHFHQIFENRQLFLVHFRSFQNMSKFEIVLNKLPTEKYKRYLVRDNLDIIGKDVKVFHCQLDE